MLDVNMPQPHTFLGVNLKVVKLLRCSVGMLYIRTFFICIAF